ncbi:MAG TPA: hypothetical protein VF178_06940 [Gemmatimonadaceae bacterium]
MLRRIVSSKVVLALALVACAPRQVEVRSGAAPQAVVSLSVTNRLTQAINVYVNAGETDTFLRQVGANTTELIPVPNLSAGTSVQLKARTADGTRTYTRDNVVLSGTVAWEVR